MTLDFPKIAEQLGLSAVSMLTIILIIRHYFFPAWFKEAKGVLENEFELKYITKTEERIHRENMVKDFKDHLDEKINHLAEIFNLKIEYGQKK